MFDYVVTDEDYKSVMSRALTLEQDITYNIEVKKGTSLHHIRKELVSIDVKNQRKKKQRRQAHSAQLNEYSPYGRINYNRYDRSISQDRGHSPFNSSRRFDDHRKSKRSHSPSHSPFLNRRSTSPYSHGSNDDKRHFHKKHGFRDRSRPVSHYNDKGNKIQYDKNGYSNDKRTDRSRSPYRGGSQSARDKFKHRSPSPGGTSRGKDKRVNFKVPSAQLAANEEMSHTSSLQEDPEAGVDPDIRIMDRSSD